MVLQAIKYERGKLQILDQLELPYREAYINITSADEAYNAIKAMQVRGAPAIAIVAALSIAVWLDSLLKRLDGPDIEALDMATTLREQLALLVRSRPTAVNLSDAARKLDDVVCVHTQTQPRARDLAEAYIAAAEQMLVDDVQDNERIGQHGAQWVMDVAENPEKKVSVLTHCNTGSLATAGYGTALGIVRTLHAKERLRRCFYTETRPYNQGCRLTGYELIHDQIPATLITDSMAAALMRLKGGSQNIVAVVVGADRVAANGDTANKIGTYGLAILARHHGIKFLVAAPRTTVDLQTKSGNDIVIEERPQLEVTTIKGPLAQGVDSSNVNIEVKGLQKISIAAPKTEAWNPAFDVTPADLIDGIATEVGVVEKRNGVFDLQDIFEDKPTKPLELIEP